MKLVLLNTTIATNDGVFLVKTISTLEAVHLFQEAKDCWDSAIGHESAAQMMGQILGSPIPVNRQQFQQQPGQKALVFKLKGRAPEGKILSIEEIKSIGYEFKIMELLSDADQEK